MNKELNADRFIEQRNSAPARLYRSLMSVLNETNLLSGNKIVPNSAEFPPVLIQPVNPGKKNQFFLIANELQLELLSPVILVHLDHCHKVAEPLSLSEGDPNTWIDVYNAEGQAVDVDFQNALFSKLTKWFRLIAASRFSVVPLILKSV